MHVLLIRSSDLFGLLEPVDPWSITAGPLAGVFTDAGATADAGVLVNVAAGGVSAAERPYGLAAT